MILNLIEGLLCLSAAAWMLFELSKTHDQKNQPLLNKFIWLYVALLIVSGVQGIVGALIPVHNDFLTMVVSGLTPVKAILLAFGGVLLALYLAKKSDANTKPRLT